ncbi:hypothetical protein E6O75_ATG11075 [Venturia nashicola]|uniref:Uncharacterized protein n=1 Tax=Venturia nashicola TaxID=86259 RepID=A0A4Z1PBR5_9PEZI|nr:hypothetical protein E6O75_ATG11075 [Venturia nashicola]
MCTEPVFQHTCGHRVPLEGGLERCHEAEEAKLEQCDDVEEEVIEDAYPCMECFEKEQDTAVEEEMRAVLAASADDFKKKEEEEVEEQIRAVLAASANEFKQKEEEEVEEQLRAALVASVADETRRAEELEEREMEMMLEKSMEGVSLEDKWEIDDMREVLQQSYREYRRQQEEEFRKRGYLKEGMSLPEGEWTRRETIHDRVSTIPTSTSGDSGRGSGRKVEDRPGPSRSGPALAHSHDFPIPQSPQQKPEKKQENPALPPPPPPPPTSPKPTQKRLQEYPPNTSPSGSRHPLILNNYLSCSHDIPAGKDATRILSPNELSAIRNPTAGKCPNCIPPPLNTHVQIKSVEVEAGNTILPLQSEPEPEVEVEVERELTIAELRAKRLAIMEKGQGK